MLYCMDMKGPVMPSGKHVRCKRCGAVLPGWLRLPNVPNSAMLLHHLGADHLVEVKSYLQRMETEAIDKVVMELFERVAASDYRA
jgi:hypothetical protein